MYKKKHSTTSGGGQKKIKVWRSTVSDKLDHAIKLNCQGSLGEVQGCVGDCSPYRKLTDELV